MSTPHWFYIVAAALGTSIGILVPSTWFLVLGGSALYIALLWIHSPSLRTAFLHSALYSLIVSAAGIIWFWDAYPLGWMGLEHDTTAVWLLLLAWGSASVAMSVGPTITGVALWALRTQRYRVFLAGLLFVLAEELRMWGFALLTYAPASPLGPHLSVGAVGYALSESPLLLQFASLGGVHILSGLVGASAALVVLYVQHPPSKKQIALMLTSISLILLCVSMYRFQQASISERAPLSVALVSTQFPVGTQPDASYTAHMLAEALAHKPDIVVFPEGFSVTVGTSTTQSSETVVVSSGHGAVMGQTSYTVDLIYDSTTRGRLATQHKEFLMALGEYTPRIAGPLFSVLGSKRVTDYLDSHRAISMRGSEDVVISVGDHTVAGLLCSEALSPYLYRPMAARGATVLIAAANPSWFGYSHVLYEKMVQVAQVHAVENNAYYIQASNVLPSFIISPRGELIDSSGWGTASVLYGTIR